MIRELQWSQEIHAKLQHEEVRDCLEFLGREVQAGISQLWECTDGRDTLHVITRLDRNPTEWVICYARGTGMLKFGVAFVQLAARKGWRMRMHTTKESVARLCRRLGFVKSEIIMRL